MGSEPVSFEEALGGLRERFVLGCAERFGRMEQLLDRLDSDPADGATLRDLMIQFHGLSGAGSTYGFPRASVLGLEGERLCEALVKEKTPARDKERTRCRSLLSSLREDLRTEPVSERDPAAATEPRVPHDLLVVDADVQVRASLERLAARDGMTARGAATCSEALAHIERRMPDAAVVDVRLPDGSGYALVERLRALPGGDRLAILMLGEPLAFVSRVDAIHCGADAYFD